MVLAVLLVSVTAYAFSSVAQMKWHSRLEKGVYRGTINEETEEQELESTQRNVYVIVSDPIQIPVNSDEPATDTDEDPIEESDVIEGE